MATQVSPGVLVQEVDKTLTVPQVLPPVGGISGHFVWGPVEDVTTVASEDEMVAKFGKPNSNSADYFFTAANFLSYSNALRIVRVVNSVAARAATTGAVANAISGTYDINTTSAIMTVGGGANALALLHPGMQVNIGNSSVVERVTVASVTNSTQVILSANAGQLLTSVNAFPYGVYIKNTDHYEQSFANGDADSGQWAARWVGALGNSLRVEVCASANAFSQSSVNATTITVASGNTEVTVSSNVASYLQVGDIVTAGGEQRQVLTVATNGTYFTINSAFASALSSASWARRWKYSSLFGSAPGTSAYAAGQGGVDDELHVVVVDEDGRFTGTSSTVLEKYAYVSKASDAKTATGSTNYYKDVINRQSSYVWWLDHPTSASVNWGSPASGLTFGKPNLIQGGSLFGGIDGGATSVGTTFTNADLIRGYDLLANESVQLDVMLGASANTSLATYIINNVVLARKYTMGFFSPTKDDVVNPPSGTPVERTIAYREALPSTSYAVLDSGWKYQYDKYNDMYRWVPLNGDTAGCLVRTAQAAETWFSPAGFSRGQIKNVIKLAHNPKQVDRDDLYVKGVNPVVTFPGQGTVLYGDKTLLTKPSAFDRINVRRLFIVLEQTIEKAAQELLFEQNDEFTRNQFVNLVEPFLRQVKGRRGISEFLVVCDETNNPPDAIDRNEFRADVFIKPIRSINFIQLNVVAVRSDVAFNEIITNLQ